MFPYNVLLAFLLVPLKPLFGFDLPLMGKNLPSSLVYYSVVYQCGLIKQYGLHNLNEKVPLAILTPRHHILFLINVIGMRGPRVYDGPVRAFESLKPIECGD